VLGHFREVAGFVGVGGNIEELEGGAVDVGIDGALAVGSVLALGPLGLPGGRDPEVGGEGVGLVVGDVPDDFVVAVAVGAHGVVHLDLVEGVRGESGVPAFRIGLAEDTEPRAAVIARGWLAGVLALAHFFIGDRFDGGISFDAVASGNLENGGGDIGVGNDGLVDGAALFQTGIIDDEGHAETGLVDGGFGTGEGHAVIGGEDEDGVFPLTGFLKKLDESAQAIIDA